MSLVQHQRFISFKKDKLKTQFLGQKGVATKRFFFYEPVFCKMRKVIIFWGGPFLGKFWLMLKNTIQIGISAHF